MISYRKLWRILEKRKMSKAELEIRTGMSNSIITRMVNNKGVSTKSINKICEMLECQPADIMEFVPDIPVETHPSEFNYFEEYCGKFGSDSIVTTKEQAETDFGTLKKFLTMRTIIFEFDLNKKTRIYDIVEYPGAFGIRFPAWAGCGDCRLLTEYDQIPYLLYMDNFITSSLDFTGTEFRERIRFAVEHARRSSTMSRWD